VQFGNQDLRGEEVKTVVLKYPTFQRMRSPTPLTMRESTTTAKDQWETSTILLPFRPSMQRQTASGNSTHSTNYKVTALANYKVTALANYKVTALANYKVTALANYCTW